MKSKEEKVSSAVIRRLPRYRRYLRELQKKGIDKVSSSELSALIGYTASQIRQDLNNFGGFGQQGYGYNVSALHDKLNSILGLDKEYKLVIVGGGNLGQAIANYTYYYKSGFVVSGIFEVNPRLIGMKINDIPVYDCENMVDYIKKNDIEIGIICTTKDNAQKVANNLVAGGVKGIWNFAPVDLELPDDIAIENVHLSDSLHSLVYHINSLNSKEEEAEEVE